jgi:hypothetical protein
MFVPLVASQTRLGSARPRVTSENYRYAGRKIRYDALAAPFGGTITP